ncbi:autotransporter outer membrane beta-barrel domain-containing protein [Paludibacterium denitrificans]|nr:autotransporter domain-containing protein [Paludibacterium denitrificans]
MLIENAQIPLKLYVLIRLMGVRFRVIHKPFILPRKTMPTKNQLRQAMPSQLTAMSPALAAATAAIAPQALASITLSTTSTVVGAVTSALNWTGGNLTLTNNGSVIVTNSVPITASGSVGTLLNNGRIDSSGGIGIDAVVNSGTLAAISNTATIVSSGSGVANNSSIFTLTNTSGGMISGGNTGISNANSIGTLSNSGTISGSSYGLHNTGTLSTLTNNGNSTISGNSAGIYNDIGSIGTLSNSGTISGGNYGLDNTGVISSFANSGLISGGTNGLLNNGGTIGTLTNTGTIQDNFVSGLYNVSNGTISLLNNSSGTISGAVGLVNLGSTIGTITNGGLITGTYYGIYSLGGTFGTLSNTGTISGSSGAIYFDSNSSFGTLTNSGLIAGAIQNDSSNTLTISGGTGSIFGTLTGFSGGIGTGDRGSIVNTISNVNFASGNLLLNDNINVTGHTVTNSGATLLVNNPITITGNYNQDANATLQIGVAGGAITQGTISSDTGYGRLVVSGNSTIASGSTISLKSNGYAFAAGQRYVVVDTAGTANYNPTSLNYAANGFSGVVTGAAVANAGKTDLVLSLNAASAQAPATVPNAISSLNGLLSYTGINSPELLNLYNAALGSLNQGSTTTANHIGKQLSATQLGWAPAAPTIDALNIVGAHVDSLRLAQSGNTGISTGDDSVRNGVWGQIFGGHASQDERDHLDGNDANYSGLLLGADTEVNSNWRAGGAFSYSNTTVDNTGDTAGNSTDINSYGLIGYASYIGSPWYLNLSGAIVQQRYDTTRLVSFTGFTGVANGRFNGQQYEVHAEAGYPITFGNTTLTPLAGLSYSYLKQNAYTESGGNGAALSVDGSHAHSVRSILGAKLETSRTTSIGEVVPDLQVKWLHEFNNKGQRTGVGFAADPTGQTAFTTVGARPISNLADISLGLTLLRTSNLSISLRYEVQAGPGFVSQTGALRLRQLF